MASRKGALRGFETELERSREEAHWRRAVDLAQQLKARSPQHESLAHFLIGEAKLEAYLEECPASPEQWSRAQRELSEARGYLSLAADAAGRRAGVALDAHLLLGKLHYACGQYEDALKQYQLAELSTLTEKELPVRSLRIVAESYAIRGLCLELSAPSAPTRYKQHERDHDMVRSFELAAELTLLYLQRTQAAGARAGPVLETALQRAPILHMRAARLHSAIDRYREMLRAVESPPTQALRLTLARQLAEVLMRGVTGQVYRAPAVSGTGAGTPAPDGPWKPKKYCSINQFVPANEYEEVVLVLLVGEAMAARDAVLSQSGEFAAARDHALRNAVAVLDLLALRAARWGQLCLLLEALERAMKFSFGSAHVWRQRALATAAAAAAAAQQQPQQQQQQYQQPQPAPAPAGREQHDRLATGSVRALGVLRRARVLCAHDAALRLVGADTCYHMGWVDEGIALSEEAVRAAECATGATGATGATCAPGARHVLARGCLYAGIGYQMKAQSSLCRVQKAGAGAASEALLLRAVRADDNDHRAFYHLALHYVRQGRLNEAMDATRSCLVSRAECGGGLRLCCALWSCAVAGPRGARALAAARLAHAHYPAAEWPLWALATLQLTWETGEAALSTGKELLSLVSALAAGAGGGGGAGAAGDADARYHYAELDALSDSQQDDAHSARVSVRGESSAAHRLERALSEGASSVSSGRARPPLAAHRARAWLTLADLCLRLGRASAAAGCVSEAAALTPYSHLVMYTRGLVHAACCEWEAARGCFQSALAIHPTHTDSMVQLGAAYYQLGWLRLAEKWLREAVCVCPRRAEAWRRLALVLAALGEAPAAADAAAAALALQPHEPALHMPL